MVDAVYSRFEERGLVRATALLWVVANGVTVTDECLNIARHHDVAWAAVHVPHLAVVVVGCTT